MAESEFVLVLVTASSVEEGERIAAALVDEGLAACVNLCAPVRSIYRWQGAVERVDEILLLIKAARARFAELSARVQTLHSYDTPEVIALPIDAGSERYLAWLRGG